MKVKMKVWPLPPPLGAGGVSRTPQASAASVLWKVVAELSPSRALSLNFIISSEMLLLFFFFFFLKKINFS